MVVTRLPATLEIGVTHERTASPSRCTVQQPQMAMPQPYFVPVRPRSSRNTQSRGLSGSTSTEVFLPLRVNSTFFMRLSLYCGQAPPLSSHSLTFATNSSCVIGGVVRPSPGFQPHNTSGSLDT